MNRSVNTATLVGENGPSGSRSVQVAISEHFPQRTPNLTPPHFRIQISGRVAQSYRKM